MKLGHLQFTRPSRRQAAIGLTVVLLLLSGVFVAAAATFYSMPPAPPPGEKWPVSPHSLSVFFTALAAFIFAFAIMVAVLLVGGPAARRDSTGTGVSDA